MMIIGLIKNYKNLIYILKEIFNKLIYINILEVIKLTEISSNKNCYKKLIKLLKKCSVFQNYMVWCACIEVEVLTKWEFGI